MLALPFDAFGPVARVAVALLAVLLTADLMGLFRRSHFNVAGKHVLITGGSQGLGLALAQQLAAKGANITIVARTVSKLEAAVTEIEASCIDRAAQRIRHVACDLREPEGVAKMFDEACAPYAGQAPDVVFALAGAAGGILGMFTELDVATFRGAFDTNYFATLWTTREAARRMARQAVEGHIILVSSVAALVPFAGYSAYAPAKLAMRGLAEALRNELLAYKIRVSCHFPATILSPGLIEENKCKPPITTEIEGVEEGQTPEVIARKLIDGLSRGHVFITTDWIGDIFRNASRGLGPRNSIFYDGLMHALSGIVAPVFRMIGDRQVRQSSWVKQHVAELRASSSSTAK